MKLQAKRALIYSLVIFITTILLVGISLYSVYQKGKRDLVDFEKETFEHYNEHLRDVVAIVFSMVEQEHLRWQDESWLASYIKTNLPEAAGSSEPDATLVASFGNQAKAQLTQQLLSRIADMRYDGGEGYFWITDDQLPYPTMVMHAAKPDNNGKVMKDARYNVALNTGANIYQARVELAKEAGAGYIEYVMNKPGSEEAITKRSYSLYFKPLGWVISSGVYTDRFYKQLQEKELAVQAHIKNISISVGIIGAIIIIIQFIVVWLMGGQFVKNIDVICDRISQMAQGVSVKQLNWHRKDEIGQIGKALDNLIEGVKGYVDFAAQMGKGNFSFEFKPLSDKDRLGNELLQMRDNLQQTSKDAERRNWIAEGQAKFSDLLRQHNNSLNEMGDAFLEALTDYLHINQGILYAFQEANINDGAPYFESVACYAFSRKKYLNKRITDGDGLVWQCYLDREMIFLTELPDQYINIRSGLGNSAPRNVVLIPLLYNEKIHGVLEVASFDVLEQYELNLLQNLCDSLASAVSALQVNLRTSSLLEESQQMAAGLKSAEEELRQNQEEMQATQEELSRSLNELETENEQLRLQLSGKNETA